jgi:hypothetical protein
MQAAASVWSAGAGCGDGAVHELTNWYPSKQVLMATGHLPPSLLTLRWPSRAGTSAVRYTYCQFPCFGLGAFRVTGLNKFVGLFGP